MTTFHDFGLTVLDRRATQGVRGIRSERHRWKLHVSNACFAPLPIREVRPKDIRAWVRDMSAKKAADTRGDRLLTPQSIKRSYALVSSIFTAAIEEELLETNPCVGVKVPKRADEASTKEKWTYLTLDEQKALATCEAIPYEHRVAIRFAIGTGLRQGEQFSLRIADLHVDGDEPHVFVRYGSPRLPPKSGKARKVPLFGDGLMAAREALELTRVVYSSNPEALVFPTPQGKFRGIGKPLGRAKVSGRHVCAWKGALQSAGVRNIKWHSLRHTCATNLVTGALGRRWTLEEIQPLMGHSAISITQMYAHVGEDALKKAARETAPRGDLKVVPSQPSVARTVVEAARGMLSALVRRIA
jgi:integrase